MWYLTLGIVVPYYDNSEVPSHSYYISHSTTSRSISPNSYKIKADLELGCLWWQVYPLYILYSMYKSLIIIVYTHNHQIPFNVIINYKVVCFNNKYSLTEPRCRNFVPLSHSAEWCWSLAWSVQAGWECHSVTVPLSQSDINFIEVSSWSGTVTVLIVCTQNTQQWSYIQKWCKLWFKQTRRIRFILSASSFVYQKLFVKYYIDQKQVLSSAWGLPPHFTTTGSSQLN